MRRADVLRPVAAKVAVAEVVGKDEEDVGALCGECRRSNAEGRKEQEDGEEDVLHRGNGGWFDGLGLPLV
jgi:hypothetical protein